MGEGQTVDYIFETRERLDERIALLSARAADAREEAEHASGLPGMLGPARNAKEAAKEIEAEILSLREVALRVAAGYPLWEREGFEDAVDACGEWWEWQPIAEAVTREFMFSHDDSTLRIPVAAQRAYADAVATGLFAGYTVCTTFDVDVDEDSTYNLRSYLFGKQQFPRLGDCLFLIDVWEP